MRIEAISSFTDRAAVSSIQELRRYYYAQAAKSLAESNYLRQLGAGVNRSEAEAAKNAEMFATIRRAAEARSEQLRAFVGRMEK